MSERRRPGATRPVEEGSVPAPRPVPAWRLRLYRVPVLGVLVYLIWPPRKGAPSLLRRSVSWSSALVAVLGFGMIFYPVAGHNYPFFYRVPVEKLIEWSNFLSDWQTNRIQRDLEDGFWAIDPRLAGEGEPLTRIEIPKIGLNSIVVSGISQEALKAGAGHYPMTPLPGERGNVGIAGHRTTWGRPFNQVDALQPQDEIILTTPLGRHTYKVTRDPWITDPKDWGVVEQTHGPYLTLTTCHPKGSARERLIVRAKLVRSEPVVRPADAA